MTSDDARLRELRAEIDELTKPYLNQPLATDPNDPKLVEFNSYRAIAFRIDRLLAAEPEPESANPGWVAFAVQTALRDDPDPATDAGAATPTGPDADHQWEVIGSAIDQAVKPQPDWGRKGTQPKGTLGPPPPPNGKPVAMRPQDHSRPDALVVTDEMVREALVTYERLMRVDAALDKRWPAMRAALETFAERVRKGQG